MFNRQSIHIAFLLWGGILCLIAAICMYFSHNFNREKRRWLLLIQLSGAVLLFSDAVAWGYRGSSDMSAYLGVRMSNFFVFILSDLMLFFFHGYVCCCLFPDSYARLHLTLKKQRKDKNGSKLRDGIPNNRIEGIFFMTLFGAAMVVFSQLTDLYYYIDAQNYYHRSSGYFLALLIPMIGMLLEFSIIIQYRKKISKETFIAMILYLVLPFAATIILIEHYGISFSNIAICCSIILMFIAAMIEQNQNLAQKEKEAADMRIAVMVSQIQPHFMYNSLNTIYHLCDKDPELAKEAVNDFSEYLQYTQRSIQRITPVSFNEELQNVKNYLHLEKIRFGDDLNIFYQICVSNFFVPALSVQPIVENAVRHGICQKEDGGTLVISTHELQDTIEITVADDGVGFDPSVPKTDHKPHVGIQNTRQRIQAMCRGTLEIHSQIGKGTTVTIRLPKEKV